MYLPFSLLHLISLWFISLFISFRLRHFDYLLCFVFFPSSFIWQFSCFAFLYIIRLTPDHYSPPPLSDLPCNFLGFSHRRPPFYYQKEGICIEHNALSIYFPYNVRFFLLWVWRCFKILRNEIFFLDQEIWRNKVSSLVSSCPSLFTEIFWKILCTLVILYRPLTLTPSMSVIKVHLCVRVYVCVKVYESVHVVINSICPYWPHVFVGKEIWGKAIVKTTI